jgi:TonB family protein
MLVVSVLGHLAVLAAVVLLAPLAGPRVLPMVAYTVEITDPNALGGRTPPGALAKQLTGGATVPAPAGGPPSPPPEAQAKPPAPAPEPPKPPEPKAATRPPEPAPVKVPEPKVEAKPTPPPEPKVEPKPEPKPVAKAEPPKPAVKPEPPKPVAKAEPPKPAAKVEPKPEPKATPPASDAHADANPAAAKPASKTAPNGAGGQAVEDATPHDAYGAAAERWRQRAATGGGLGGQDEGSGPIGSGGNGKGGGGQLTGLEFIAYKQQVVNKVRSMWTTPVARPGMLAVVMFEIAEDGAVTNIRLERSSGNAAYDASALRAVQSAGQLPPPPAAYYSTFHEFHMEFHPEDMGGQGQG